VRKLPEGAQVEVAVNRVRAKYPHVGCVTFMPIQQTREVVKTGADRC